jgi:hypothetical protein
MKSLTLLSALAGVGAVAVLATMNPAEARPKCTRVETPNDPAFVAMTHCTGVTLPPFFEAIGWQRNESRTWPGSDNTQESGGASSPPSKGHDCPVGE